jgi:hypothetical protein
MNQLYDYLENKDDSQYLSPSEESYIITDL